MRTRAWALMVLATGAGAGVLAAGAAVAGHDSRVAVEQAWYLKTTGQLLKDLDELEDRAEDNPNKADRKWMRERIALMRKDLQDLRADVEHAPQVERLEVPTVPSTPSSLPPTPPPVQSEIPPPPTPPPGPLEMASKEFSDFVAAVKKENFDADRLKIIKEVAKDQWFTTAQVRQVLEAINYNSNKVDAGVILYPHVVDKDSWFKIYDALPFSSDKDKLRRKTSGG